MIHAVILAGGWGRRFWPKSRKRFPKQILKFSCVRRPPIQDLLSIIRPVIPKERIWIVTNKECLRGLHRQLSFLSGDNFLVEPLSKNTAAAVGWASTVIRRADPQAICVVLSCDNLIERRMSFLKAIKAASALAKKEDALVTIGIKPNRPAEEYGYIKTVHSSQFTVHSSKVYKVEKFIEKPSIKKAKAYLKSKTYLWNAGIFIGKATTFLQAIKRYLPRLYTGLQRIDKAWGNAQYKRQLAREYKRFRDISIDYGVMEKARNIYTVAGEFCWQDLGSWGSFSRGKFAAKDKQDNIVWGLHKGIDTWDSVVFSEGRHLIGTIGLRDLVIVHTPSATLVCKKDKAQDVKKLTKILEKDKQLRKYL